MWHLSQFAALLATLLMLFPKALSAQGNTQLVYFRGGKAKISFSSAFNFVNPFVQPGQGPTSDLAGIRPGPGGICGNPATIVSQKTYAALNWRPGMSVSIEDYTDLQSTIRQEVDAQIADMKAPGLVLRDKDYPLLETNLGPAASLSANIAFPIRGYSVALAIYQPFSLFLRALVTGMEARLKTVEESDPGSEVTFFGAPEFSASLQARSLVYAIGVARSVTDGAGVGISVERYSASLELDGRLDIDGLMVTAGNERAFNDPNDPWPNNLYTHIVSRYSGSTQKIKLGATYRLNHSAGLGLVFSGGAKLKLKGFTDFVQYTIPGLNLEPQEGEDMLDPTKVSLDEPTRTRQVENPTGRMISVELPGSVAVGVSGYLWGMQLASSITISLGNFNLVHVVEKPGYSREIKLAVTPGLRYAFGLEAYGIVLDAGFRRLRVEYTGGDTPSISDVILPDFHLGYHFRIARNLTGLIQLLSLPDRLAFLGVGYSF